MNDNNTLDLSREAFQEVLDRASTLLHDLYSKIDDLKGFNVKPEQEAEVAAWFAEPLPEQPMPIPALFEEIQSKVVESATGNLGKNMYAYVMSGGNQISTVAELILSTINQNGAKWHLAPAMTEIERRVVKWATEMTGFTPQAGGAMVSGGSEANLGSLTVARNVFFRNLDIQKKGLFGHPPFTLYCSTETHNCIDKSISLLGIGADHIRRIPARADFTIDLEALEARIVQDKKDGFFPFCIVGNAGTVNTGAIDDLEALAALAQKHQTWFHVDGAYGGLASAIPGLRTLYAGMEKADSVALDFHKWLYQPFEIGCFLVKNWEALRETYFKRADYLEAQVAQPTRFEYNEHYFQLSRNAKAFKVWMSVKAYGFAKIRQMIQKDIDLTHYLADLIEQSPDFVLKSRSSLAIACFQYKGAMTDAGDIEAFNQRLAPALEADGRIFIAGTRLHGEFVLRACLINHRKDKASVEYLLEVIREVAGHLR